MGIFDFFKRKSAKIETESENLAFNEIEKWVENKNTTLKKDEQRVFEEIGSRLGDFYVSIEENLRVLEGIDIESKKEHERAKILVRQGLDKYVNFAETLIKDLKGLMQNKNNLNEFAQDVVSLFNHFEKSSASFYGRANYLVGDEMAAVRNQIRRFYNDLIGFFENSSIKDLRNIEVVKLKLGEFERVRHNLDEIKENILAKDLKIEKFHEKIKKLESEIKEIKNSSEYASGIKDREEIKIIQVRLDNEIKKLKELIDFKRLTNLVHSNEREMGVVKDYKTHFAEEFSKDNGRRLFDLMNSLGMKSSAILTKINLIEEKRVELDKRRKGIRADYTINKLKEIKEIKEKCENIELENIKEDRRLEELRIKLKGLKNEIIGLIEKFKVSVV